MTKHQTPDDPGKKRKHSTSDKTSNKRSKGSTSKAGQQSQEKLLKVKGFLYGRGGKTQLPLSPDISMPDVIMHLQQDLGQHDPSVQVMGVWLEGGPMKTELESGAARACQLQNATICFGIDQEEETAAVREAQLTFLTQPELPLSAVPARLVRLWNSHPLLQPICAHSLAVEGVIVADHNSSTASLWPLSQCFNLCPQPCIAALQVDVHHRQRVLCDLPPATPADHKAVLITASFLTNYLSSESHVSR